HELAVVGVVLAGGRLVQQQHLGLEREHGGDADPFALAVAEGAERPGAEGPQPAHLEHLLAAARDLLLRQRARAQPQRDLVEHTGLGEHLPGPAVAVSNPHSTRASVDFPAPLEPSTPSISPQRMRASIPSSATMVRSGPTGISTRTPSSSSAGPPSSDGSDAGPGAASVQARTASIWAGVRSMSAAREGR